MRASSVTLALKPRLRRQRGPGRPRCAGRAGGRRPRPRRRRAGTRAAGWSARRTPSGTATRPPPRAGTPARPVPSARRPPAGVPGLQQAELDEPGEVLAGAGRRDVEALGDVRRPSPRPAGARRRARCAGRPTRPAAPSSRAVGPAGCRAATRDGGRERGGRAVHVSGRRRARGGSGGRRRTRATDTVPPAPRCTQGRGPRRPATASSIWRWLASGSCQPVSRPSTTRTPRSGVTTSSVQPSPGWARPSASDAVSSVRTTVVPVATTSPPAAWVALTSRAVDAGTR